MLAVASSGGHWVQLLRLRTAWQDLPTVYLTTEASYAQQVHDDATRQGLPCPKFYTTIAANRWQKLRLIRQLLEIAWIVMKERPTVVCTTGAAPGYFAIRLGKLIGARTIWIDSIANAGTMSLAGIKAGKHADVWLTQWESVTAETHSGRSPQYWGAVL